MTAWIVSIVGVICLGVLLEIVLPEGQTTKYVKGAFSLLVVFVIVAPIPAFLKTDWKIDFEQSEYRADTVFIYETVTSQIESVERDVEDYLLINGYDAQVKITLEDYSINKIRKIEISVLMNKKDAENMQKHIGIIKELVSKWLNEEQGKIYVGAETDLSEA